MAHDQDAPAIQLPPPDPAVNRPERSAGTLHVTGHTVDSEKDNLSGRFTWQETNRKLARRLGGRRRS